MRFCNGAVNLSCKGNPPYKGSPPTCHKARGVVEHKTPRDRYTVKKLPKNLWGLMRVSDRTPVTNFRASVTFGVCILCGRRTGVLRERTTASLLGIQTEPKQTWSRLPRASETSGLLSQVETLDKQAASGMWRGTLLHWKIIFSSAVNTKVMQMGH